MRKVLVENCKKLTPSFYETDLKKKRMKIIINQQNEKIYVRYFAFIFLWGGTWVSTLSVSVVQVIG